MSTSDAEELELRVVVGGETPTPQCGTARATRTTREQKDERFLQENHRDDETPAQCHPSVIRQEHIRHTSSLLLKADRQRQKEAACCGDSKTSKPIGPSFTSSLFFSLQRNLSLDNAELDVKKNLSNSQPSYLTETKWSETEKSICQVNGQTSQAETTVNEVSNSPIFERIPAKKREEGITVVCNGKCGPHERKGSCISPCGSQSSTATRQTELEVYIEEHTEFITDLVELSKPTRTMLSSTMVTVLAPHWSGRLRRNKRFEGTGNAEVQDVTNTATRRTHEHSQVTADMPLTDGSQAQLRVPFLGTGQNTVGSSTKSVPASFGYESKRKHIHTVPFDLNSGRMDNRKIHAGTLSPTTPTVSPGSALSLTPSEERSNPQTGLQEGLPSLSSKPTTSSLLLSLRRCNSNGRKPNEASALCETNPSPLITSSSDQGGQLLKTRQESKPPLSPPSTSYRTTEIGPILSPLSSNLRGTTTFETGLFSASSTKEDTPFTQQPQTATSMSFVSSPKHPPYDHSVLRKTHSSLRRTTLTSTSWWKQVSQEGSSPVTLNDTTNINNKPKNTPLIMPCNEKNDLAFQSLTDNKRLNIQISNNKGNNNTVESVDKGNFVMKPQGGPHILTQRKTEESHDHKSEELVKQYDSNLNFRELSSSSKVSRAAPQTIMSHPKDLTKCNETNISFTANITELPLSYLNLESSNTPTESSSKHKNNHCSSKTNNTPTSSDNKNLQSFTKPSLSIAFTSTLNRQALTPKAASGLPLTSNPKTSSSFTSDPVALQTSIHALSYAGSSSTKTPNFIKTTNTTQLGFEKSFASIPKPFHSKSVPSQIPPVSDFLKTNCSPVSTISLSPTDSHPAAIAVPSSPLLCAHVAPDLACSPTSITSSFLTPPATPIFTSPKYSDTPSPKEGRTFSSSQERDPKKQQPRAEGKRMRRVTWEDSVDLQHSEESTVEKPEQSQAQMNTQSPSKSLLSIKAPYIFSFLRSSSLATNKPPLCSPTPKTSSLHVGKTGKYRSLSSDSADVAFKERERLEQTSSDCMVSSQRRTEEDFALPRPERTFSVESDTGHCCSSAPLSLPPDFSSGYKLRYSSPPYSTLMSTRATQVETKTITPRARLFQQPSQSNDTLHLPIHTSPIEVIPLPMSKPPVSPISPSQHLPLQNKVSSRDSSKCGSSETNLNNHSRNKNQDCRNDNILLVNNRVHIHSQSQQREEEHNPSSAFVTETLVYSIKPKADMAAVVPKYTTLKPLQHITNIPVYVETKLSQQSHMAQSKEAPGYSDQGSSGSSSTESQPADEESSKRRMKESVLGKSRFFSVESNNEQHPKKSRFALKKSVSTPNSSLSRSDSDRSNKTNNKMDQVLNRLRQTFSTRRSDDDVVFPWKWKRASQTPSTSGSSDVSNVSDITVKRTKTVEKQGQEKVLLKGNEKEAEVMDKWSLNRFTLKPPSTSGNTVAQDKFYIRSERSSPDIDQDEQDICAQQISTSQTHLTHSPTMHHDFYKDMETDYKSTNQFLSCRDSSPGRISNPSAAYPTQFGKSTPSPRSPFSPFSSLSPLSSFPSPEVTDDSVFYSPKLQRRRESSSPCEPLEGFSLGSSRRSRASTGPASASSGQDKEGTVSSCADLKYGIEPSRSFSVSSVLSSRPSGPGRISTGSRFMSVGDLSESALTCRGNDKDLDYWSVTPDWHTKCDYQPSKDFLMSYHSHDPGKMRSRSLPRSLTRCLANWSSRVSASLPVNTTTSKPAHLWGPNMNTCHFAWDTAGPPTPPPTPPLSPVSRRMSKPPSLSSSSFPSSSGAPQPLDSQSSRGHLPSRGYVSSLSTFEESSDSSSDTTTDDEYYLEIPGDDEKETEL